MNHHLSLKSKIIIMLSIMASIFLVALDQMIFSTSLGKIVEEFNAYSALSWVITAYMVTTTVTVPIAGKFSDMFGRKLVLMTGIAIFSISSLFGGLSGGIEQLIFWRALQGIGGGIITANAFAIVGDLFAARERGRWQGLVGAVFGFSSVAGPLIGGYLTESHNIFGLITNWRWTILMNVPIGVIAFLIIAFFCPMFKYNKNPKIDFKGAFLLTAGLSILILAIDNTESIFAELISSTGISLFELRTIMIALVILISVAFIRVERSAKEPIIPLHFFNNRNFLLIITISMLFGAAFLGSILYLTQFNQQVFGVSPTKSGLMLLPMVCGMMVTSIGVGQLISKTGKYKTFMLTGFIVVTIAIFCMLSLNPNSKYLQEAIIIFILGIGMGVGMPIINLAVQNEFAQEDIGVATSSSQLFRSLGSTIGIAVFGAMLTATFTNNIGDLTNSKYIQMLRSNNSVSKMGDLNDSNTLLAINNPTIKIRINEESDKALKNLPVALKNKITDELKLRQDEYSNIVVHKYSNGMHRIFLTTGLLMAIASFLIIFIREKPLRSAKPTDTPGEM